MLTGPRLRSLRRDDGVTLAELLVAMGLSVIVGTMATIFFVGANRAGNVTLAGNQISADARVSLDDWTSLIRVAGWLDPNTRSDRFEEITPTKIVFWANLGNRSTSDQAVGAMTKVALMLNVTDQTLGTGQLVEILFQSDNTTVQSVRQLGFNAGRTAGSWIFAPVNEVGGAVDTTQTLCRQNGSPVVGLCAAAPANAGLLDPTIAAGGLTVSAGPLTGDGSADSVLAAVARIDIAFTVIGTGGITSMDYASSASVNSGFPS